MNATSDMPWGEPATVVRIPTGDGPVASTPQVLFEGRLRDVLNKLSDWPSRDLEAVRLSLADRSLRPRDYEGAMLFDLIRSTSSRD